MAFLLIVGIEYIIANYDDCGNSQRTASCSYILGFSMRLSLRMILLCGFGLPAGQYNKQLNLTEVNLKLQLFAPTVLIQVRPHLTTTPTTYRWRNTGTYVVLLRK